MCIRRQGGKNVEYLISRRGIEANPSKIQAIAEMSPPTNPKEVQRLAGCLSALSRFLAKSTEHSLPFFKTPRVSEPFSWTPECQEAFEALRTHLSRLKTLAMPLPGDGLLLYLSVSASTVSAALVREEKSDNHFAPAQKAVYYVLEALAGAKT